MVAQAFLYTNNEQSEKEIIKIIPFIMLLKRIKYLVVNSTKEVEDLNNEDDKTLLNEVREGAWKHPPFTAWKTSYCHDVHAFQS